MKCPLCQAPSLRIFERHEVWIADCSLCGHRFADLEPTADEITEIYGDEYFEGGGAGYQNYLDEADLLRSAGRRYAAIVSKFTGVGTMLDIGAAAGFILKGFEDAGWHGTGIELNDRVAEYGRKALGLDIRTGGLESYSADKRSDLVTMIQVVPHLRDPRSALKKVAGLTNSGGYLLIETWRRDSVTAKAFGQNWHEYSPPSVLHWFTRKGLKEFVESVGFEIAASGRPSKWINAGHAASLIRYKLEQLPAGRILGKGIGLLPSKINLPYPAEDLVWMLFRKK